MKVSLSHNDVITGICMFLESRGLSGFDPSKVHASFSVGRKSGEITCELNDDPEAKAQAEAERNEAKSSAKPKADKPAAEAGKAATKGGEAAAAQAAPLSEKQPESPIAQAADAVQPAPTQPVEETPVVPTTDAAADNGKAAEAQQAAGEDNLFG